MGRNVSKSKRLTALDPPITPTINNIDYWTRDTVRKIWESRITSITKAWEEIEILSVSDGLRDCCLVQGVYNHELLSLADRHPELSIFILRETCFWLSKRNTWSLRSLSRCLTDELDIPISFKHLQRITKDLDVRCNVRLIRLNKANL